jgi:hypothetical protein
LGPAERLWRQWRPNVTHNHTRSALAELVGVSVGRTTLAVLNITHPLCEPKASFRPEVTPR